MSNYPYPQYPLAYADALGIRTAYYSAGEPDGRPVVLLHGMSTSADSFRELMHELAADHWLIAPDIPGFGYSENTKPYTVPHLVEWLAAFQDALELPPMALVGHSFGGLLAASFALDYEEDVTGMVLLAPALLSAESYPDFLKRVGFSLGLVELGSTLSQSRLMVKRQIKVPFYDPSSQHASVWERRLKDYELARASAAVLRAVAFHNLRPHLKRVHQPVRLIWGENDPVVPVSDADELAGLFPHADVHRLAKCGHVPILEHRRQVAERVRHFLHTCCAASPSWINS
ncbi:MAG: alpha/beta fold hydrolase [Anaerolineae bacterium]